MNFMPFRNEKPKLNFQILDGLRGVAACYVVINHCRGNLLMGGKEYAKIIPVETWSIADKLYYAAMQLTILGREFVVFFFILSGFSIAHSLSGNNNILSFYRKRAVRLYPPYIAALAFAGLVFFLVNSIAPHQLEADWTPVYQGWGTILSNLVYIPKGALIAQFWSLTHEIIFYLLIALLYTRRIDYYIWLSVYGYLLGCSIDWNAVAGSNILEQFVFDYNIFFVIGIVAYRNYDNVKAQLQMKKSMMILFTAVLFISMMVTKFLTGDYNRITPMMAALLSLAMIVNFLSYNVRNSFFFFLGKMSYTIYITHFASIFLFILLLNKFGVPYHSQITQKYIWPIGVVFCLVMAIPLYYLAEHPTKKILDRLRRQKARQQQVSQEQGWLQPGRI